MNKFWSWIKKSYIAILLLVIYVPLIFLVVWSFVSPSEKGNVVTDPNGWGFENYLALFTDNDFLNSFMNTVIIVSIVTPLSVMIATITCYAVWNNKKSFEKINNGISKISLVNPEIITAVSLTLLFASTWIALGMQLGFFTIILSHISFCTPYAIVTIYPRMQKFKSNLIDASKDLGYSSFKTFFNIVVPYLLPSIVSASALVIVMSFDDFIITNLVRGRVTTISTEMYLMTKGIKAWAVAFGALLVVIYITVIAIKNLIGWRRSKKQKSNKQLANMIKSNNSEVNSWKK